MPLNYSPPKKRFVASIQVILLPVKAIVINLSIVVLIFISINIIIIAIIMVNLIDENKSLMNVKLLALKGFNHNKGIILSKPITLAQNHRTYKTILASIQAGWE